MRQATGSRQPDDHTTLTVNLKTSAYGELFRLSRAKREGIWIDQAVILVALAYSVRFTSDETECLRRATRNAVNRTWKCRAGQSEAENAIRGVFLRMTSECQRCKHGVRITI